MHCILANLTVCLLKLTSDSVRSNLNPIYFLSSLNCSLIFFRRQFFLNGSRDLEMGKLRPDKEQSVRIQALIAQARDGDFRENHIAYNPSVTRDWPNDFRSEVIMEHCRLRGMPRESAEYKFLEEISALEDYGTEYHSCRSEDNKQLIIGVGIEALKITKQQDNSGER